MSFDANAQSSSSMGVDWSVANGDICKSAVISQAPPDGPDPVQTFTQGNPASGTTVFIGLHANTRYTYQLVATFENAEGSVYQEDYSTSQSTPLPQPPPPPKPTGPYNVAANYNHNPVGVTITWTAGLNTTSFEVIRYGLTFQAGSWQKNKQQSYPGVSAGSTSLVDKGAGTLQAYQYEVIAHNQNGSSLAWSNQLFPGPAPAPSPAPPLRAPTSVKAAWSGGTQIAITWVPAANDPSAYLDIYHRVGIGPLVETGASPWVVVASHLNINSTSFTDTRPHVPPERHIYKVCAVDGPQLACSTPVAAPL